MMSAKIIRDSISDQGHRLTTFEVTFHRFVLAEFNTHRVFSRNSASSRAIPFYKQVGRMEDDPVFPVKWATEQQGMQGGEELPPSDRRAAQKMWEKAKSNAIYKASELSGLGVHKSLVNRLLEPFMWHTVVVTSTAWNNYFQQRVSPLAQPEIAAVSALMLEEYERSDPEYLEEGEWHLPYITDGDWGDVHQYGDLMKVSVARCARVSYLTHDGVRDISKDIELYDKLVSADPPHWSPLEHVATPDSWNIRKEEIKSPRHLELTLPRVGNFIGWRQHRLDVEVEKGVQTYG